MSQNTKESESNSNKSLEKEQKHVPSEEEKKMSEIISRIPTGNTMFDNLRRTYLSQLSEEEIQKYEDFGRHFHSIDFTAESNTNNEGKQEIKLEEALASIVAQLKAGLHPSFLEMEERSLVEAQYGSDWYRKFGFESIEL